MKKTLFSGVKVILPHPDRVDLVLREIGRESLEHFRSHSWRTSIVAEYIMEEMGFVKHDCRVISFATDLHDIGKARIPASILLKKGKLTEEEFRIVKEHPSHGNTILHEHCSWLRLSDLFLKIAAAIALCHHENEDGTGYPMGLKGDQIPFGAKVCHVADVYVALREWRPDRPGHSKKEALRIMTEGDGRTKLAHFDSLVMRAFLRIVDRLPNPSAEVTTS